MTPEQLPKIELPKELKLDPKWFDISYIDVDNLSWHLEQTAGQMAELSQLVAEAEFFRKEAEDAAIAYEASVWLRSKCAPYKRFVAPNKSAKGHWADVDATDETCKFMAKSDPLVNQYLHLANLWRHRRDVLEGRMGALRTKATHVACLAGLRRTELQAENRVG